VAALSATETAPAATIATLFATDTSQSATLASLKLQEQLCLAPKNTNSFSCYTSGYL
jgi:hypothetical protein